VLCCAVPCCAVLCRAVLFCAVLCHAVLCCAVPCCTVLCVWSLTTALPCAMGSKQSLCFFKGVILGPLCIAVRSTTARESLPMAVDESAVE
jgi:hypothetical protein